MVKFTIYDYNMYVKVESMSSHCNSNTSNDFDTSRQDK